MISVIIATYGGDEWEVMARERALPSVEGQAEEVIVGHDPVGTIASVRNELAQEAKGDWLVFLDADDELAPGYIQAMEAAAEPNALLTPIVQQYLRGRARRGLSFYPQVDLRHGNWLIVGTAVERELFSKVGGFSDYPHGFEDFSLWSKCHRLGAHVVRVQSAVYKQHVNPNSKHRQGWRDRNYQVSTHERVVRELDHWERFWSKVAFGPRGGCWLWRAAKNKDGYGSFGNGDGGTELAHRWSWKERRGEIPQGMFVLHRCDEPSCVNPAHLFLGTQADNVADCERKGRRNQTRYKKLDAESHAKIRELYATGEYSLSALGRQFGCTYQSIRHIVSRP